MLCTQKKDIKMIEEKREYKQLQKEKIEHKEQWKKRESVKRNRRKERV